MLRRALPLLGMLAIAAGCSRTSLEPLDDERVERPVDGCPAHGRWSSTVVWRQGCGATPESVTLYSARVAPAP